MPAPRSLRQMAPWRLGPFHARYNAGMSEAETAPNGRRRWFRFSLRRFLVLVSALSIGLGWLGWQAEIVRQRDAIRRKSSIALKDEMLRGPRKSENPVLKLNDVQRHSGADVIPAVRKWTG